VEIDKNTKPHKSRPKRVVRPLNFCSLSCYRCCAAIADAAQRAAAGTKYAMLCFIFVIFLLPIELAWPLIF